jgi:hypothetical protein
MNKEVKRRADVVGVFPNEPSIIRLIVLAQLRDLAFRDAGETHRLDQFIDPPGRHATDPGLLDYHNECLLGGLARLQERREVRALPQLGNAQAEWAESGVEAAIAVTVAVIEPVAAALVAAGADQAFDVGLHQDLQYRLGDGSQEIAIAALLQQLDKRHSLFGADPADRRGVSLMASLRRKWPHPRDHQQIAGFDPKPPPAQLGNWKMFAGSSRKSRLRRSR